MILVIIIIVGPLRADCARLALNGASATDEASGDAVDLIFSKAVTVVQKEFCRAAAVRDLGGRFTWRPVAGS